MKCQRLLIKISHCSVLQTSGSGVSLWFDWVVDIFLFLFPLNEVIEQVGHVCFNPLESSVFECWVYCLYVIDIMSLCLSFIGWEFEEEVFTVLL